MRKGQECEFVVVDLIIKACFCQDLNLNGNDLNRIFILNSSCTSACIAATEAAQFVKLRTHVRYWGNDLKFKCSFLKE